MRVAGADQRQPVALRPIGAQRLAEHAAPQVVGQRPSHAYRKDAGLLQRPPDDRRNVAGSEDPRIAHRLQLMIDLDEAAGVQCQAGFAQPRRTTGLRHPHHFIGRPGLAVSGGQAAG